MTDIHKQTCQKGDDEEGKIKLREKSSVKNVRAFQSFYRNLKGSCQLQ